MKHGLNTDHFRVYSVFHPWLYTSASHLLSSNNISLYILCALRYAKRHGFFPLAPQLLRP